MNKKGQAFFVFILIIIVVALVFIYPLGGGKNIKDFSDKINKLSCPEIDTTLQCEFGQETTKDVRGCVSVKCLVKGEQAAAPLTDLNTLQVFFLDVGQGDSIYIETPLEKKILIDAGPGTKTSDFLAKRGINRIDWIIETHPDADHIGGLDEIFTNAVVMNLARPNTSCDTNVCKAVEGVIQSEEGLTYHEGYSGFALTGLDEGLEMKILNPNKDLVFMGDNDNSIVLKLTYKNVSVLLTGDCEAECEEMILRLDKDISADILKIGHHGSKTSTSAPFLTKVNPAYAVLSYGEENSYGHPSKEVIDRLMAYNTKIVKTVSAGNIEMRTDGTKAEWHCEKKVDCFA